jgi:HAD superfamily hydrolase (TIGR01509 family)
MAECVVFDMDGVLLDSERLYGRAWRQVGARHGLSGMDETVRLCIGRNGADICALLVSRYGPDFDGGAFALEVRNDFLDIVDAEGLPLKPGVTELLDWLRRRGCRLALATSSGKSSADRSLREAGLSHYFEFIVTGDMVMRGKPAPDIYRLACEKLGAPPGSCYAVEDSPNGVRSAHAAGLKVILVPDIAEIPDEIVKLSFKTFDSLLEVKKFFETQVNFSSS